MLNLVFFTHPSFLPSQSMPRFAAMLTKGMQERGHKVETWSPQPRFYQLPVPQSLKKWMGYLDQYLFFPKQVRARLKTTPADTLFVFADQALGPWVPLVKNRPHVIHCHDFLAQRSALGEIPENPTSKSGQQYQAYIRKGYQQGQHFISVSQKTAEDLHRFLGKPPLTSEVVYNGMNRLVHVADVPTARRGVGEIVQRDLTNGYLLHVGGNQWYKNREGVIAIYHSWRQLGKGTLHLLLVGAPPNAALTAARAASPYREDIFCLPGLTDEAVQAAYAGAALFLYPSLAEGFGWPIAEAMAAGCPVVTTGEAPMTEVGGDAAVYIPRKPANADDQSQWAAQCAQTVDQLLSLTPEQRRTMVEKGFRNVERFNTAASLDRIEAIYRINCHWLSDLIRGINYLVICK